MKSTNLLFLEAVLATAEEEKDVCAVFKPFWDITRELNYVVDVVADNGYYWIKVTARNASALHRTWQGNNLYIFFKINYKSHHRVFNKILSRWQKLWSRWRRKKNLWQRSNLPVPKGLVTRKIFTRVECLNRTQTSLNFGFFIQ